jgi:proteasome lid subunit RPN8/RPN11
MADLAPILLPTSLYNQLTQEVLGRYPRKSFGYLVSEFGPSRPTGFVLFDDNIRNDDDWRDEFESRGRYFVDHPDAGFVATAEESWRIHKLLLDRGLSEIAVFHTHRRHPGNFSDIDYDLHISRFATLWHLIISLRNPRMPQLRVFNVTNAGVSEVEMRVVSTWTMEPTKIG